MPSGVRRRRGSASCDQGINGHGNHHAISSFSDASSSPRRKAPPTVLTYVGLFFRTLATLPYSALTYILDFLGMSLPGKQVLRVTPSRPAIITTKERWEGPVSEWVGENVPSLRGVFTPSKMLPTGHLQTMYSVIGDFTQVDQVKYKRTYLRVPDGGTIGLDFAPVNYADFAPSAPFVVVCHGLTGGSHESYVRNVLSKVIAPVEEGGLAARAVVVNFRGCAGVPITSPRIYSAATTYDLSQALHFLRAHFPKSALHGIGFSLGASVLAHYLGEASSASLLSSGIVIGAPWDIPAMSVKLESHWFISRIYSSAMGNNLLNLFFYHYDRNPALFEGFDSPLREYIRDLKVLRKKKGRGIRLKMVDEVMVSKVGGPLVKGAWPFERADDYYEFASPKKALNRVERPMLAINAFDDPIIDGASLPIAEVQAATYPLLYITSSGGHLGWFDGSPSKGRWVRTPVLEFLVAAFRDLPQTGGVVRTTKDQTDGGEWVEQGCGHEVQGGGRVGWRVMDEGEVIRGEEGEGVLQGL